MKEFIPTQNMIDAAKAVFVAMAMVQTLEPIITGIQRKLLEEGKYPCDSKWSERARSDGEYITDPNQSYLMSEKDSKKYLDLLHEEIIKAGFDVKKHYCPLLIAKSDLTDAKRELIIAMEPVITPKTGLTYEVLVTTHRSIEKIDQVVDMTLKLLAPFVKKEEK